MASSPPSVTTSLVDASDRAVDHGLITAEQAAAIVAAESTADEHVPAAIPAVREAKPSRRLAPLVTEAIAYVGVVLATIAVVLVAQRFWADLEPWSRVALLGVFAVALFVLGAALHPSTGPVVRVRGLAWFLSVATLAATLAVAGEEYLVLTPERLAAAVAATCALYGVALWWRWPRALQQLAVFVAVTVAAGTGLIAVDPSLSAFVGLMLWAVGVAWLALTWSGIVRPMPMGYVLAAIVVVIGPRFSFEEVLWPLVLGVITGVLLIVASLLLHTPILLGAGVIGLFIHIPMAVFELFGDTLGAPVSLFITGVVLVALALVLARLRPGRREGPS